MRWLVRTADGSRRSVPRGWPALSWTVFLTLSVVSAPPAYAGGSADSAEAALRAFGGHAGYIAATVIPCGGSEAEIDYFRSQVRKMLDAVGGSEDDFATVVDAMRAARAEAKPQGRDCTDAGGMELAGKLLELRNAFRDAAR